MFVSLKRYVILGFEQRSKGGHKITSMQMGNSYYTDEMYTKLHSIKSNPTKHLVTLTMTGYKYRNWPQLKANRQKDTLYKNDMKRHSKN
jgi:hypothetical protein